MEINKYIRITIQRYKTFKENRFKKLISSISIMEQIDNVDDKKEQINRRARAYYHMRCKNPEFVAYTNNRVRNLIQKKKLDSNNPVPKLGRPKKIITEPPQVLEKKKAGRHLKYPNEIY